MTVEVDNATELTVNETLLPFSRSASLALDLELVFLSSGSLNDNKFYLKIER